MKTQLQLLFTFALSTLFCLSSSAQCFSEQSFTSPGEHNYTVSGDATETFLIEIETRGGDGGDFIWSGNPQTDGGEGATLTARFEVSGGDDLFIIVGEAGSDAIGSPGGGGGGGGSAVIINGSDVLIAAAAGGGGGQVQVGGGAGASTNSAAAGGAGPGTSGGGGFNEDGEDGVGGTGGGAGTLTSQGAGGTQGVVAGPGGDGFGGGAGGSGTVGGGGGGYQGGDGASGTAGNYGGMGGDSYVTTLYNSIVMNTTAGADGGGASLDGSVTITCIPTTGLELAVVAQNDPSCFGGMDGSIEVTGLGGVQPYSYSINNGPTQSDGVFENLSAGTYTLSLIDGSGSFASQILTLTQPNEVFISLTQVIDNICFEGMDGSIEVEGSGGSSASGLYMYSIDNGPLQSSNIFTGLAYGTYSLLAFDDNGCASAELSVLVNDQVELVVTIDDQTDVSCAEASNGSVTLSTSGGVGGYTYSTDGVTFQDSPTISDLGQGEYTFTVMDADGCTTTIDVTIGISDPFTFLITSIIDSNCGSNDGAISLIATGGIGGFTYSIDGEIFQMSNSFSELAAGTYTATAMDGAGCIQELEFTIQTSNSVDLTETITPPTCAGGTDGSIDLMLTDTGESYTFVWAGEGVVTDQEDQSGLAAGTYMVTVTDMDGCSIATGYTLADGASIFADTNLNQNASCNGSEDGAFTASATGGEAPYTYTLDGIENMTGVFSDLAAGMYQIVVADANGCTGQSMITITEPSAITMSIVNQTEAGCGEDSSGTVSITSENGVGEITYSLNGVTNTTGDFTDLAGGIYTATATDENNCSAEISITILQNSSLAAEVELITNVSCNGGNDGAITVSATGGSGTYSYSIDGGAASGTSMFTDLSSGEYLITANDTEGCAFNLMVTVQEPDILSIVTNTVASPSCNGIKDGSITLQVLGGTAPYDVQLADQSLENVDDGELTFSELEAGEIPVTITDANSCTTNTTLTLTEPDELVFIVDELIPAACNGGEDGLITIHVEGGTAPYTITENGESEVFPDSEPMTFVGIVEGDYNVTIEDDNGCTIETVVSVVEPDELIITNTALENDNGSGSGSISLIVAGGTLPYQYSIDGGDSYQSESTFSDLEADVYSVLIVDANGCFVGEQIDIILIDATTEVAPEVLEVSVGPIPASNRLIIDLTIKKQIDLTIQLTDITGKNIKSINATKAIGKETFMINVDDMDSGLYLLNIYTSEGQLTKKVIVQQ